MPRATTAAWLVMPPRAGEDALGGVHAVDVFRAGLDPDQDHASPACARRSASSAENTTAGCSAGRCRQAAADDVAVGIRVERRVQQVDPVTPVRSGDSGFAWSITPSFDHVHGDLQRRLARALAGAGLQHPQLASLHRELDVLHVACSGFQPSRIASSWPKPPA